MSHSLTIVVPVYNERENLQRLCNELLIFIEQSTMDTTVLFVNDGSTDGSLEKLRELCYGTSMLNYISFDKNYGLSTALTAGFDFAESSLIGYMDADLQTHPMDFNLLLPFVQEYELVTGWRTTRKDSLIKKMSSNIANGIRRSFTHDGIQDTGCPLKIIHAKYAKRIPMFRGLHRFLPAMVLLQKGKVKQIPVSHYPRIAGKAKFGLRNRLLGPLMDCFAFLWMKKKYITYNVTSRG